MSHHIEVAARDDNCWITLTVWALKGVMFAACALAFSGMWLLFDQPVDGAEWGWLALRGVVCAALFIGFSLLYERR
ncbi:hypothetical protein ACWDYH_27955 [Nocardia goodfellowii]